MSIFGESAGGGMISAVFLDEKIRGSIQAAMAMSGSIVSSWSVIPNARQYALNLGSAAGCPNDTSNAAVECMTAMPLEKLVAIIEHLPQLSLFSSRFVPTIDGEHIKDVPARVIANAAPSSEKEATFITGYLKEDYSLLLYWFAPQLFNESTVLNQAVFRDTVGKLLAFTTKCPQPSGQLIDDILAYYNVSEFDTRPILMRKLFWFGTDAFFGYPALKESILYSNRSASVGSPNQLYFISYDPGYNGLGAFHAMDLVHLFRPFRGLMRNHTVDEEVTRSLQNIVRQVAHDGDVGGAQIARGKVHARGAVLELPAAQDVQISCFVARM